MDPTTEAALALHQAPGIYALLLGSGVSRGAQVPTGWEVTLDLVTRLAVASGEDKPTQPAEWYRERYGTDPDYSDVLEQLADTPEERQTLLRAYFEPTEQERADGIKQPTKAHHAIADLAGRGLVRVILTTNFDLLIEQALEAAGITFDLWFSSDAISGGVPLTHGRTVVVKLHGDYRDTRVRNTLTELENYDSPVDTLLDRVLDEFGLIICGWSGVWDAALRKAILRAPNRRFRTFWTTRGGQLGEAAQEIADHRDARLVPIDDADRFFGQLRDKVDALAEAARPHPESVKLAAAMVKRYLPDLRDRIRLTDAVMDEARRLHGRMGSDRYPASVPDMDVEKAVNRAHAYEADVETLLHTLAHLGALADRSDHAELVARSLELTANPEGERNINLVLLNLRLYPALIGFYAAGIGAVSAGNWQVLQTAALTPQWQGLNHREPLLSAIHPYRVFERAHEVAQALATGDQASRQTTPVSDRLYDLLREPLLPLVDTDQRYDETFNRFEYLAGLLLTERIQQQDPNVWVPDAYVGRLRWRYYRDWGIEPAEWADQHATEIAPPLLSHAPDPDAAWAAAKERFDQAVQEVAGP